MYLNLVFSLSCCALYASISEAAPVTKNDISPSSMNLIFSQTMSRYDNFMTSPEPRDTVIPTRELPEIKIIKTSRYVTPKGVIVQKCPEYVGFSNNLRKCKAIDFEKQQLVVEVDSGKTISRIPVLVKTETKCICSEDKHYL